MTELGHQQAQNWLKKVKHIFFQVSLALNDSRTHLWTGDLIQKWPWKSCKISQHFWVLSHCQECLIFGCLAAFCCYLCLWGSRPLLANMEYSVSRLGWVIPKKLSINQSWLSPWCHIYASVNRISIGSDNGFLPIRRQAIIQTNTGLVSIGPLGTNFSEILIKIWDFSFMKMYLKYIVCEITAILSMGRWVNHQLLNCTLHLTLAIQGGCQYGEPPLDKQFVRKRWFPPDWHWSIDGQSQLMENQSQHFPWHFSLLRQLSASWGVRQLDNLRLQCEEAETIINQRVWWNYWPLGDVAVVFFFSFFLM